MYYGYTINNLFIFVRYIVETNKPQYLFLGAHILTRVHLMARVRRLPLPQRIRRKIALQTNRFLARLAIQRHRVTRMLLARDQRAGTCTSGRTFNKKTKL